MIDSTRVVLPAAEAFRSGILRMQEEATRGFVGEELSWSDYPVNAILVTIFTLLALLSLRSLLSIFPKLLDSLSRWKACVNIDASIQTKSDRNDLGLVYTIPIALLVDRYDLMPMQVMDFIPESLHGLAFTGLAVVWLLLRHILFALMSTRTRRLETFRTAYLSFFNYWILMGFLMVITGALASVVGIQDATISKVLLYELAVLYAIAFLRKSQILRSYCNPFVTFLYLCGLEILPTGALIAGAILL